MLSIKSLQFSYFLTDYFIMSVSSLKCLEPLDLAKVTANKVFFIKLGRKGEWESECILKSNTLRLGFNEADFQSCRKGEWDKIKNKYLDLLKNKNVASGCVTQIKYFFQEPEEDTIWITFFKNKLWWTKAKTKVLLKKDGTKTRSCLSKWSDKDIKGNELFLDKISGKLLKTQGFRGTICAIKETEYLLRKINSEKSKKILLTEESYKNLKSNLRNLIKELTWQDFETLIDLIFTQAGWKRVSKVGKTAKTLDLDLEAPVTNEKCLVQIKSSSDNSQLRRYLREFEQMDQYHKFYYVCHTFKDIPQKITNNKIKLLLVDKVSELAIDSGLSKWIIDKVS